MLHGDVVTQKIHGSRGRKEGRGRVAVRVAGEVREAFLEEAASEQRPNKKKCSQHGGIPRKTYPRKRGHVQRP